MKWHIIIIIEDFDFDLLGLSQTWLNRDFPLKLLNSYMDGYGIVCNDRNSTYKKSLLVFPAHVTLEKKLIQVFLSVKK